MSDFQISGQIPYKQNLNCHNSRTSNDNDMKLRPITKLEKRNAATIKKNKQTNKQNDDLVSAIFRLMVDLEQLLGSGCMAYNSYIYIDRNFLSHKK